MSRLSNREKLLSLIVLYIFLAFTAYHFIYQAAAKELRDLQQENENLIASLQRIEKLEKDAQKQEPLSAAASEEYKTLQEMVPADPQIAEIVDFLRESAQKYGVEIDSIQYKKAERQLNEDQLKNQLQYQDLQIELSGRHDPLISFLIRLEHASRLFSVQSVKLSCKKSPDIIVDPAVNTEKKPSGAKGTDEKELQMWIKVEVYHK